jgi:hypothetical protein
MHVLMHVYQKNNYKVWSVLLHLHRLFSSLVVIREKQSDPEIEYLGSRLSLCPPLSPSPFLSLFLPHTPTPTHTVSLSLITRLTNMYCKTVKGKEIEDGIDSNVKSKFVMTNGGAYFHTQVICTF